MIQDEHGLKRLRLAAMRDDTRGIWSLDASDREALAFALDQIAALTAALEAKEQEINEWKTKYLECDSLECPFERRAKQAEADLKACQWQPIDTAPKERAIVLLYVPGKGRYVGWWSGTRDSWIADKVFGVGDLVEPTHWAVLLDPPDLRASTPEAQL